MTIRLTRAIASGLILLAALVAPVAAVSTFEISDTGTISPSTRAQVDLFITVNCTSDPAYPTGTATIELEQVQRGGSITTASGATPVTCDGVTRIYAVTLTSTDGTFRKGAATVSGETRFMYTLCAVNEAGDRQCTTFEMSMFAEDQPIDLRVGR